MSVSVMIRYIQVGVSGILPAKYRNAMMLSGTPSRKQVRQMTANVRSIGSMSTRNWALGLGMTEVGVKVQEIRRKFAGNMGSKPFYGAW
jgi:hypothetical protein